MSSNEQDVYYRQGRLVEREIIELRAKRLKRFNEYSWGVEDSEDGQYVLYRDVLKIIGAKND